MYRIDDATAATSLPVPEAAGTEGYFTEGNPATGTPATKVRGSWLNMIQEELSNILAAAGIARSKTAYNQVNAALQKMYGGVIGSVHNGRMYVAAASSTATYTADEVIVETALGAQPYRVASINQTVNLATPGAGGMDTGSAPANGYVALYAIYNPVTKVPALLATNATSAVAPSVYGGANMPSGYTASALLTVVPTNGSGQFKSVLVNDRSVSIPIATALSTSTIQTSPTLLSIASIVPANAKSIRGELQATSSSASQLTVTVVADSVGQLSQQNITGQGGSAYTGNYSMDLATPQQIYYTANSTAGTPSFTIYVSGYSL
ncbi:hypothetical protein [Burkholderia vietnamiensis]|uniref:hypothetical protein n=1 Tax=Burkholderia vietnamiensis TaxID=60552 RepID=UPI001CF545D5|nr:hypothetical protein [Burkholderia vietnamiensis]MCA8264788.1 hypothetical protein [Burkholderia vietnamiensis]